MLTLALSSAEMQPKTLIHSRDADYYTRNYYAENYTRASIYWLTCKSMLVKINATQLENVMYVKKVHKKDGAHKKSKSTGGTKNYQKQKEGNDKKQCQRLEFVTTGEKRSI